MRNFFGKWKNIFREHKILFFVDIFFIIGVVSVAVSQFFNRNYYDVFLCGITFVMFLIPPMVSRHSKVYLPDALQIIIVIFIFSAQILGEIKEYYLYYSFWDTALHTVNGFLCGVIGFAVVNVLHNSERFYVSLSPLFLAMFGFCFSMTIGVFWEFIEFTMDCLFHTDMQKDIYIDSISSILLNPAGTNDALTVAVSSVSINDGEYVFSRYIDIGLFDTMKDLIVNFVGAFASAVVGYFYAKGDTETGIFAGLMPRVKEKFYKKEKMSNDKESD